MLCVGWLPIVHGGHVARLLRIVEIDAARATTGGFLRAHDFPFGMLAAAVFHVVLHDIVVAHHVERLQELSASGISYRGWTCGVQPTGKGAHGSSHADALLVVLKSPLFVAITPEDDTGMIAVALDHAFQKSQMLVVDAHQTIFVDYEYSLAVADIQEGGSHGIVRRTVGIASQLLQLAYSP